jgi:peptidoglycan hydrolase-like protein with peptidoglycan-binding domain
MMKKLVWLCFCGAVLVIGTVPEVSLAAASPPVAQSSAKARKKKAAHPQGKRRVIRRRGRRVRGQAVPTADRIREIQSALQSKGALNQEPNGKWDAATIEAMKKYQADNGLSPTGKIDAASLQKLGLGSDIAGKGAPIPTAASPASDPAPSSAQ